MQGMKIRWIVIWTTATVVVAGLALLVLWLILRPPSPDRLILGMQEIKPTDLPEEWQGLSDAELRDEVESLVSEGIEQRGTWRGRPFDTDKCRQIRLAALLLDDGQLGVRSLYWLGGRLRFEDQYGQALDCLDTAIHDADRLGLSEELAECQLEKGECLEWIDLYERALESYSQAYATAQASGNTKREMFILYRMAAVCFHRLSRYDKADEYFQRIQVLAESGTESNTLDSTYRLWGLAMVDCGRLEEALDKFKLSLGTAERMNDANGIVSTLICLADVYGSLNNNELAEAMLERAMELSAEQVQSYTFFDPQRKLAAHYWWTGRRAEAEALYLQTLEDIDACKQTWFNGEPQEFSTRDIRAEKVKTLGALGGMFLLQGEPEMALEYLQQAQQLNDGEQFLFPMEDMTQPLAQAYLDLGQAQDALDTLASHDCSSFG